MENNCAGLFQIKAENYLVTADYRNKFLFVDELKYDTMSKTVTRIIKKHCSVMVIPEVIRSDNGPQYIGSAFQNFTKTWGIQHVTSSPRYPQSNGFIERQVGTVKNIITKAK